MPLRFWINSNSPQNCFPREVKKAFPWHDLLTRYVIINYLKFKLMLRWTIIFLIIAVIAGIFGFFGIAAGAASIAKILFFIFIVLFLLSFIGGRSHSRSDL